MLIRALAIFLLLCTACRSGILPCPEVKGLKLKKSGVSKRIRIPERPIAHEVPEPVITVSSDAKTPQTAGKNKYRYMKYTMQHVDIEEMDCPKPDEKKVMPRAVKDNIRKNRRKIRYYYEEAGTDSLITLSATYPKR
jgi:hypothetical protein